MTSGHTPGHRAGVLALYAEETAEHVAGLRAALDGLGAAPSSTQARALVETVRRDAHGIVGSSWTVGLDPPAQLMQAVELACVVQLRTGTAPSEALLEAFAAAVDAAESLIVAALAGVDTPSPIDVEALVGAVNAASGGDQTRPGRP